MQLPSQRWQFALFFLSGFAGLVYQIVWLRLAFASFGVVTPVISVVLSGFMLGLGIGSWVAGSLVRRWPFSRGGSLRAYAGAEFLIGVGGLAVPLLFAWGERVLLPAGETDSFTYLASSAAVILVSLVPFCLCMGVTFPFMLQAIRAERVQQDSFSYLYLANVLGAMIGVLLTPLVLVELLGFQGTLWLAICANWTAGGISLLKSFQPVAGTAGEAAGGARERSRSAPPRPLPEPDQPRLPFRETFALTILFTTGLTSMGMEVVWARAFTPVLLTQVYSFSGLLFTYLLATWCGSALYRRHLARGKAFSDPFLLGVLSLVAFGQLLLADPRLAMPVHWMQVVWLLVGIMPYCGIMGYLTPKLIDEYSVGRPGHAGHAYAINVLGSIIGPLLVSYLLLPRFGVQWSGVVLAVPLWGLAAVALKPRRGTSPADAGGKGGSAERASLPRVGSARLVWGVAAVCGLMAATVGTSYEDQFAGRDAVVLRDHTATVIAYDDNGRKDLLLNGKPITSITPTTKLMAHLPLTFLQDPPERALVICFGMGTTYRSLLSWGIESRAVELVPSVRDAFGYFFDDAAEVLENPSGAIIIDDGRRYLKRTEERFDVITLDPPPPVEAAGSSLLYSTRFYELIKPRLSERGILHQWFPGGELTTFQAVIRSITEEFPHVRVMRAFDGWGYHILASMQPIPQRSAEELAARLPESARRDLLEWSSDRTPESLLRAIIGTEIKAGSVLHEDPRVIITDNLPYNEYYLLRRAWQWWTQTYTIVL